MVKCPMCGRQTMFSYQTKKMHCPACGWGTDRPNGHVGGRARRKPATGPADVGSVLLCWVLAAAIVAGLYYLVFNVAGAKATSKNILIFGGGIVLYAAAAWVFRPAIDTENLGWFGGLMNNPFRISDDIERLKLHLLIVFYPGRAISGAVVGLVRLLRRGVDK